MIAQIVLSGIIALMLLVGGIIMLVYQKSQTNDTANKKYNAKNVYLFCGIIAIVLCMLLVVGIFATIYKVGVLIICLFVLIAIICVVSIILLNYSPLFVVKRTKPSQIGGENNDKK